MSQPKNAEPVVRAKRDPSTYVSRTVGLAAGESSRVGLENFIEGDFNAIFEGATVRLKEENRYRTFVDLERIAGWLPTAIAFEGRPA